MPIKKKIEYVPEEELAKYRFTIPYMYERKLTDEIIEKFDIGFDANWIPEGKKKPIPCVTFPVRDIHGNTLFLCRRSVQGKIFNYPRGVTKPVYGLYELPQNVKTVVICESCFNALTSWRYGKPAVALLGTGNPYQIQQLKQIGATSFILALDPDEAGQRGTEKLKRALKSVAMVYEMKGIPVGKDINDLTEDEFNNLEIA
jgi:DNA primase